MKTVVKLTALEVSNIVLERLMLVNKITSSIEGKLPQTAFVICDPINNSIDPQTVVMEISYDDE